jgi:PAS domain S-box-containing protein
VVAGSELIDEFMKKWRNQVFAYLGGAAIAGAAIAANLVVEHALKLDSAFLFLCAAVAVSALLLPAGAALVTLFVGMGVHAWIFFKSGSAAAAPFDPSIKEAIRLLIFAPIGIMLVLFAAHLRATRKRLVLSHNTINDSEFRYRTVMDATSTMVWNRSKTGEFESPQSGWTTFTGQSFEQLRKWGWLEALHPDDRQKAEAEWLRVTAAKEAYQSEYRLRRCDGEYRHMSVRAVPVLDRNGDITEWLGVHTDISDRRLAEQQSVLSLRKLDLAVEAGNVGAFSWNVKTGEMEWSAMHYKLFGVDLGGPPPRHEQFLNMVTEEDRRYVEAEKQAALAGCRDYSIKYRLRRGDGLIRWFECHGRCHLIENGRPTFVVGMVRDITDETYAESKLRQSQAELRALNQTLESQVRQRTAEAEMRSEQLRDLALDLTETESRERRRLAQLLHDHFQQIVSAAKMKAGMIRRSLHEPEVVTTLLQLESLLGDAIEASRSLATELSPPVLHDAGLGAALEWLARRMQRDHNLTVHLQVQPNSEPNNEQVRTILFECLRELLFNVFKHAGAAEAWLEVETVSQGLFKATVQDHGKGFDPTRIASTRKLDGSFGLFSIRERLGIIGGLIKIHSEPGKGTRIEVTVPMIPVTVGSAPAETPREDADLETVAPTAERVRVLVADDHKLFREGLISLISQESYLEVVGQAADGEEALKLARELRPQIMIVDVSMPKYNGIQVTTLIHKELPDTRVIGLSMHERDDMALAMRNAGAVAYCAKSWPSEQLLTELRSAAGQPAPV